ncbi:CsbD family protein [Ochrobactrum sp. CDB2]|nr:CsbD family protein [Ochrobactrum sp. CDB2]
MFVFQLRRISHQSKDEEMSSTTDKIKGKANQAGGAIKEEAGKLSGNRKVEAEGAAQKLKGKAQDAKGKAKDAVKSAVDKA